MLNLHKCVVRDEPTRFDSAMEMFSSIAKNKLALIRMEERSSREQHLWPSAVHLRNDDFYMIKYVVTVLKPINSATKDLSSSSSVAGDVMHLFTFSIEQIRMTNAPARANNLRIELINQVESRLSMLLNTSETLLVL